MAGEYNVANINIFMPYYIHMMGCREYLHSSVCIGYDASFTPINRWNAYEVTLRAVLEMLFMYVLI